MAVMQMLKLVTEIFKFQVTIVLSGFLKTLRGI